MNIEKILLIIIIIYLIISHSKKNNKEHFAVTDDIRAAVKEVYNTDMEAVRNLDKIAKDLQTGALTIPGNLTVTGTISGNGITSSNNVFNLLPKGIILSYYSTNPPSGWVLCDGTNNTPDLKGRFILGSGQGTGLTNRNHNDKGGTETHTLTIDEIPSHTHDIKLQGDNNDYHTNYRWGGGNVGTTYKTENTGGSLPHNNMPPYYVLTYIMKT